MLCLNQENTSVYGIYNLHYKVLIQNPGLTVYKINGLGLFSFLFGNKKAITKDFQSRGAYIVDVRSKSEYDTGAIPGSKHIPLQQLNSKINTIKKWGKPLIVCCASGARSASAVAILKSHGIEAMNGGNWFSLSKKLD